MQYRLTAATGPTLDEGEGTATVLGGALVIQPTLGQPIRLRPSDVVEVAEPEPYVVVLRLAEGPKLTLWQLGALRTQLLEGFRKARTDDLVGSLLLAGVGKPETFTGAVNGVDAELRLYDDALVTVPAVGAPQQIPYAFIDSVDTDAGGYQIAVAFGETEPVVLQRMARRTSEFVDLLRARVNAARGRTSAFLAALLPGLGSIALRSAASLLRDGLAASKPQLDAVDPRLWPALVGAATLPDRRAGVDTLNALGEPWLGFKQVVSVEREASGVTPWQDSSVQPTFDHDRSTGGLGSGMAGMMTAGLMANGPLFSPADRGGGFGGGFGGPLGGLLALNMLGMTNLGGGAAAEQRTMTPRADVTRGTLTPEGTDLSALTATGEAPTILAFLFVRTPRGVLYEVLNQPDHATYGYRTPDVRAVNRALALLGFRVEGIYADAGIASAYAQAVERLPYLRMLRDAFAGRAIHTDGWPQQVARLL